MGLNSNALLLIAREYGRSSSCTLQVDIDYHLLANNLAAHVYEMDRKLNQILDELHDQRHSADILERDDLRKVGINYVINELERLA
jgi:hypothetical protein